MDINSELKDAQLEILDADNTYSGNRKGLIWFNRTTDKIKAIFNTTIKEIYTFDSLIDMRNQMFVVGETKLAMLTEAQFAGDYGTNWLKISGQTVLVGDYPELASRRPEWVSGGDIVLPSGGDFLRINTARALGVFEDDGFESHNHGGGNHEHNTVRNKDAVAAIATLTASNYVSNTDGGVFVTPEYTLGGTSDGAFVGRTSASGTIINTEGISETRPKNIAINAFIKVK